MKYSGAVIALGILAAIGAVVGCATNPVTGKSQFSLVTQEQEIQLGKEGYQAVLQEYGAYSDAKIASYVDSIGHKLASVSHQPNLEWHFTVLDDQVVNAFAMPGGYIYISRGILGYLNSEAQLAGVLGHEIGHVTAKHTAARMSQQQLAGLGLGLGGVFSRTFQRYSSVAQEALGFVFLKYSRDDETQADQLGVDYATKAGWDPREIPMTYVMLRRVGEQAGQRIPSFMSTHPDPGDREARTRELAKAAAAGKTGLVIHGREYIRHVDGLVFGTDPTQGYFEGTTFIHPGLATQMTFPTGWKTQNTHEAVLGALTRPEHGRSAHADRFEGTVAVGVRRRARAGAEDRGGGGTRRRRSTASRRGSDTWRSSSRTARRRPSPPRSSSTTRRACSRSSVRATTRPSSPPRGRSRR